MNGDGRNLDAYENDDNSTVAVQYKAGGYGLNLQKAHYMIYWNFSEECDKWMQSKSRVRRIGQKDVQVFYNLITKNSIEEKILDNIRQGKDYTDALFVRDFGQ